jgi:hypothetical protein
MTCKLPRDSRVDTRIVKFRPRLSLDDRGDHAPRPTAGDICRLLDLSRYEAPRKRRAQKGASDNFNARVRENIAAAIVLLTLVSIATFDVIELEQMQRCESVQDCSH